MVSDKRTVETEASPTGEVELSVFPDKVYVTVYDSHKSQYLANPEALFKSAVKIENSRSDGLSVKPILRRYNACRGEDAFSPERVHIKHTSPEKCQPTHLKLIETVATTISGLKESDFWQGYRKGSGESWEDVAWTAFFEEWDGDKELMMDVGEWYAETGTVPSNRTAAFFPIPEWGTTSGGNYVATISQFESGKCPECGESLSDTQTVTRPSGNNARKATHYKCDPEKGGCGYGYKGITTG